MLPQSGWLWVTIGLLGVAGPLAAEPGPVLTQLAPPGFSACDTACAPVMPRGVSLAPAFEPGALPGVAAPLGVVDELKGALVQAIQRFNAKDLAGVLAYVSDQYRTGPMTKAGIRAQLATMFQLYDAVQAQVRIDEVQLVGDQAWIYSTGQVRGLLPWFGSWMTLLDWQHEPEVARREQGRWRLFGFQQ